MLYNAYKVVGSIACVELTQGKNCLLDVEDIPLVSGYRWHTKKVRNTCYVTNSGFDHEGKYVKRRMHRLIMRELQTLEVDHINGDGLDNRKSNLRFVTPSQNQQNSRVKKSNTSGYKGVSWNTSASKWLATIRIAGKKTYLGSFDTKEDAYNKYCLAAIKHYGEFARLK